MDASSTADALVSETDRWKERLKARLEETESASDEGQDMIENARAYLKDAEHFEDEDDMVRAFEAVVWGWAWLEIGEKMGLLDSG